MDNHNRYRCCVCTRRSCRLVARLSFRHSFTTFVLVSPGLLVSGILVPCIHLHFSVSIPLLSRSLTPSHGRLPWRGERA
jgi:hypothetical protein